MPVRLDVTSPDGTICEVVWHDDGSFSPLRWKAGIAGMNFRVANISPALRLETFSDAKEAMMSAFRERSSFRHGAVGGSDAKAQESVV